MRDKPCIAFFAVALFLCSCQSERPLMVPETQPEGETEVPGWISIADGTFHPDDEGLTPDGYYVKGVRKSWETFHPKSEILGKGRPVTKDAKTTAAWIELDDGSIHPVQDDIVPRPPYVRGHVDEKGLFYPNPAEIVK